MEFVQVVKDFMLEGIQVIKRDFISCKKGPEPTMRKDCFVVYKRSETEMEICCTVDDCNYPDGFNYGDDHTYCFPLVNFAAISRQSTSSLFPLKTVARSSVGSR